jgi:hypothetical protein
LTRSYPNRGFALLITITLLAFLVLLLVSLSSLSRVETQVADNNQKISQARQNAMAGLNIALGQLQRHAGPDLRVTASAGITSPARNAHFAGIWVPPAAGADPVLTTWLVSGNEGSNPLAVTPASAPNPTVAASGSEVFLVDSSSVSTDAERVKLARQAIQVTASSVPGAGTSGNVTVGHYAYWVGDQGVKVSAALYDQSDDLTYDNSVGTVNATSPAAGDNWSSDADKRARLRQLAQPRPRTEKVFAGFDPDAAATRTNLSRVLTSTQLPFVDAVVTSANLKTQFHHATALSEAVLVDLSSGTGRLRQDLSDTPDLAAANETALRAFLRTRPASVAGVQATYTPQAANDPAATGFPMASVGPVLTEFAVRFQFHRDSASGTLRVRYDIQAELWNPYAASLTIPSGGLSLEITGLPTVTWPGGSADLNTVVGAPLAVAANTVWAPGQIRVLSSGATTLDVAAGATLPTAKESTQAAIGAGDTITIPQAANTVRVRLLTAVTPSAVVLASYTPGITFTATTVTAVNDDSSAARIGYAYDFRDDLRDWTDGSRATASDPRRAALTGAFFDPGFPFWEAAPQDNYKIINQAGGDNFNAARTLALFDLPRQEVVSAGSLQHVAADKPYSLGNTWGGANNALFDRFFLSTLPRWMATMPWDPRNPPLLPNRHLRLNVDAESAAPAVGDPSGASTTTSDYLLDRTHAAKYLLQRGAFNINSTSIPAWSAVLGGVKIPAWSHGSGAGASTAALNNAFFRLPNGGQELAADPLTNIAANEYARGARTLTDAEVTQLATAVVSALKARGRPFPTLASFVNAGVIANAIASVTTINQGLAAYSPGSLSQADVLTAIAPFITPRSDTFLVRAYGDVQNPVTNAVEGRVWCEALVQRLPDLTAPASGTLDAAIDPLAPSPAKYPFGRRFKIVSFRWLSPSDI